MSAGEKFASLVGRDKIEKEKENFERAVNEIEGIELERRNERKNREAAMRATMIEDKRQADAVKIKETREKKEIQTWETLQRFKRDEYNKRVELEDLMEERKKKINYARDLRKHMVRKIMIKKRKNKAK